MSLPKTVFTSLSLVLGAVPGFFLGQYFGPKIFSKKRSNESLMVLPPNLKDADMYGKYMVGKQLAPVTLFLDTVKYYIPQDVTEDDCKKFIQEFNQDQKKAFEHFPKCAHPKTFLAIVKKYINDPENQISSREVFRCFNERSDMRKTYAKQFVVPNKNILDCFHNFTDHFLRSETIRYYDFVSDFVEQFRDLQNKDQVKVVFEALFKLSGTVRNYPNRKEEKGKWVDNLYEKLSDEHESVFSKDQLKKLYDHVEKYPFNYQFETFN